MDFKKLAAAAAAPQTKINDSARAAYMQVRKKLGDSIRGKSRSEILDSALSMLKDNSAENVIRALVALLGKKDSRKFSEIKDSESYKAFKAKIKDELGDTESTEDAIDVVTAALEEAAPIEVLAATVEVLGEAIDVLQDQIENPEPEPEPDPEEDYIEDSATHKGKLRIKDSFCKDDPFEGNGIKGKIVEVNDDSIVVEVENEDGVMENKEIKIEDIK